MDFTIGTQIYVSLKLIGDYELLDYRGTIIDRNFDFENNNYILTLKLRDDRTIIFNDYEVYHLEVYDNKFDKRSRDDDCCIQSIKKMKI